MLIIKQILTLEANLQDKLKERERELRKRKEREEQEMERVRLKVRRKEAVTSFQALLVETVKDPMVTLNICVPSWFYDLRHGYSCVYDLKGMLEF